jgi:serine/threonine-protein kinase
MSTTVAAVIQSEPRWDGIPQSMLRLLKRCLTKDPRRRLRDIGDVWELLDVESSVTPRVPELPGGSLRRWRRLPQRSHCGRRGAVLSVRPIVRL